MSTPTYALPEDCQEHREAAVRARVTLTRPAHHDDTGAGVLYDLIRPPAWHVDAACLRHPHPEWWFASEGHVEVYRTARAVCDTCPARDACLDDALARHEDYGLWGGLSPKERRAESRRRRGVA